MTTDYEVKGALGAAYWDDLRAPAVAINPPGAASDPGRDANTGWLLFDAGGVELIYITYQLPHGWIEGSAVSFHVHWHKSTSAAGNVAWRMRYRRSNIGTVWTPWSDPEIVRTPTVGDQNTKELQALTAFTDIPMPNCTVSANLLVELARIGNDAGDTYGADAVLTDCDLHYQLNQPGSVQLYQKYRNELQWGRRI